MRRLKRHPADLPRHRSRGGLRHALHSVALVLLLTAGARADSLPALEWLPATRPAAVIIAVHGFNDYKAGFEAFATFAAGRGILVRAYDQPGFGEAPARGRWAGTQVLIDTLADQVRAMRTRYPDLPLYVLGESMGGAVAATAAAQPRFPKLDGLILSAPAVWGQDTLNPGYRWLLDVVAAISPGMILTGGGLKILASDNLPALIGLSRDPLFIKGTRTDAIKGLVGLMDQARDRAPALQGRLLVLSGYRDQVVAPRAQASFASAIGSSACTFIGYPDGWHLLLRDRDRELVYADILSWIDRQPSPSRLARPCVAAAPPPAHE